MEATKDISKNVLFVQTQRNYIFTYYVWANELYIIVQMYFWDFFFWMKVKFG